ncbi:MAG: hypothetical protein ACTS5Y_02870, partial [Pollutimonas bauzanensis]
PDLERAILRGLEAVKRGEPYFIDAHVATGYSIAPLTRGN